VRRGRSGPAGDGSESEAAGDRSRARAVKPLATESPLPAGGGAERAGHRVVQLGRGQIVRSVVTGGDEDAAVGEKRGGLVLASDGQRAGEG